MTRLPMNGRMGPSARLPLSPVTREASGLKQGQQKFTALTPGNVTPGTAGTSIHVGKSTRTLTTNQNHNQTND